MKKYFLTALILCSANVFAADRNIFDLMYLPKAGTAYGLSDISVVSGLASAEFVDIDISGYNLEQKVGYSITDRLTVDVGMNYSSVQQKYNYSSAVSNTDFTNKAKGVNDPSFDLRFRILEETLILDVLASYKMQTGDHKIDGNDYNNKQGGNSSQLGFQLGQKMNGMQWSFLGGLERFYKATTQTTSSSGTKSTSRDNAYNEWTFEGALLNNMSETSFIRSSLGVQFADKYKDNKNTETSSNTKYQLKGEYQYLLSKDVLLRGGLAYNTINQAGLDKFYFWVINAGATYQF